MKTETEAGKVRGSQIAWNTKKAKKVWRCEDTRENNHQAGKVRNRAGQSICSEVDE